MSTTTRKRKPLPRMASVQTLERMALEGADLRDWYRWASSDVTRAGEMLDVDRQRLADLLALFSPRVSVLRSIRMTLHYIRTRTYTHDTMSGIKASVEHYERTGEIRGPKTGPFARAVAGDLSAIVLDVWMARAFGIDQRSLERKPVHAECCRRIRQAARRLGWEPAEVQAAVWASAVRAAGRRTGTLNVTREIDQSRTLWSKST